MLAKVKSMALIGIDAFEIGIEADITEALPSFTIVGLPDGAVRESRERVASAIKNCGFDFPSRKVTINMAPADIKKEGSAYDLPIALGLLQASQQIDCPTIADYCILGELSLDGSVKKVKGILPMALTARNNGYKGIILPQEAAQEASVAEGLDVFAVDTLLEAISFLEGDSKITPHPCTITNLFNTDHHYEQDFIDVKGQTLAKRALLIAAAGNHNIMMVGPPGSGKTMIARRIPSILPALTLEESLEATKIHSVAGTLHSDTPILLTRPFRAPHHTISDAGLTGGGSYPRPGEISLSHHGVLFLDELPEFNKNVLENLRQPLEDRTVTISRAAISLSYPAHFMLVTAMNPCPCGYYGDPKHTCICSPQNIQRYISKLSGPLLDRIDLHIQVPAISYDELASKQGDQSSKEMRSAVNAARTIQLTRFKENPSVFNNASMTPKNMRAYCQLQKGSDELLRQAIDKLGLSARAYDRTLKVARTIADLAGSEKIQKAHIAEAIQYRSLDTFTQTLSS